MFLPTLKIYIGGRLTNCISVACFALGFTVWVLPSALAVLALYLSVLIYVHLVHGFGMVIEQELEQGKIEEKMESSAVVSDENADGSGDKISPNEESHGNSLSTTKSSNEILENTSCTSSFLAFLGRPIEAFIGSLRGNQNVSRHMVCLPGMGSLKMLKVLLDAPIEFSRPLPCWKP
jgi:hypothetical protein